MDRSSVRRNNWSITWSTGWIRGGLTASTSCHLISLTNWTCSSTRWSLSSSVGVGCGESTKVPRCETISASRALSVDVTVFWVGKMPDDLSALASTAFDLASRPGFLIRRLHQIHVALFADECATFDVTPVQYSIMTVVRAQPGLDQVRLAAEVGVDRTTLASVLARLEH